MSRFRVSGPAGADIASVLDTSTERRGIESRRRYVAILAAAMRKAAAFPEGPATRNRDELLPGLRSLHLRHARNDEPNEWVKHPAHVLFRHARNDEPNEWVKHPAHVLYFRQIEPGLIEIVRVLHERMEPSLHLKDI